MPTIEDTGSYIRRLPFRLRGLVTHLRSLGYKFESPKDVLPGPSPDIEQKLQRLEALIGTVPASLAEFYRTIGSVNLVGSHPNWTGCEYPDPLSVEPIDSALEEADQYAELADPKEEYWASESGVFRAPIAPDALHKAGVSGGMWYGVEIPNSSLDPIVLEEPHGLPFTQYLEFALSYGGFPGLATAPTHTWPLNELRRATGAA